MLLPFLGCKFVGKDLKDNGYKNTLEKSVVVQPLWCLCDSLHQASRTEQSGCFRMWLLRIERYLYISLCVG